MTKTFPEVISGIRTAKKGVEVREDIAQMGEYVEQFAATATQKAEAAAASEKKASDAVANIDQQKADSVAAVQQAQTTATTAITQTKDTALTDIDNAKTGALQEVANSTEAAETAASAAAGSASDANASEEAASAAATAAAGSASTAATKAGEASTSAGAAATSRQAAEKAQKAAEDAAALAGTRAGTDKTLSVPDAPADAKTVGDKFKSIKTDWNSVTDKPSTFPPSAHNHSKLEFENKNEVNFVGIPENNTVYLGYRDNTIDEYRFNDGRGSGSFANVRANKFIGSLDGNATTATKATGVTDYKDASRTIQVGYAGDGLNTSNLTHIAGYTDNGTKIKDVNKSVMQSWLGVTTITSQTSDPGSGSSLATGSILLVYA